jgi:hypothetical protein
MRGKTDDQLVGHNTETFFGLLDIILPPEIDPIVIGNLVYDLPMSAISLGLLSAGVRITTLAFKANREEDEKELSEEAAKAEYQNRALEKKVDKALDLTDKIFIRTGMDKKVAFVRVQSYAGVNRSISIEGARGMGTAEALFIDGQADGIHRQQAPDATNVARPRTVIRRPATRDRAREQRDEERPGGDQADR